MTLITPLHGNVVSLYFHRSFLDLMSFSPADVRGAVSAVAEITKEAFASKRKPPKKRVKATEADSTAKSRASSQPKKKKQQTQDLPDSYHFIGYVPAHGKVWELDGLKSGPLEVGELPSTNCSDGWEDIVRPALRLKMEKYGGHTDGSIEFNLLAFVQDRYEAKSDELELLKRQRATIERRLDNEYQGDWRLKASSKQFKLSTLQVLTPNLQVDATLADNIADLFSTSAQSSVNGPVFSKSFGSLKMEKELEILNNHSEQLPSAWETCAASAAQAKLAVEEEVTKALQIQVRCSSSDLLCFWHELNVFRLILSREPMIMKSVLSI